ncbi:uncharacterized [Tachysurus ichikawai]
MNSGTASCQHLAQLLWLFALFSFIFFNKLSKSLPVFSELLAHNLILSAIRDKAEERDPEGALDINHDLHYSWAR